MIKRFDRIHIRSKTDNLSIEILEVFLGINHRFQYVCKCIKCRKEFIRESRLHRLCHYCEILSNKRSKYWKGIGNLSAHLFNGFQRAARDRKIEFKVTLDYCWNLYLEQNGKCKLSGVNIHFAPSTKRHVERTASLDRIDSYKGYIEGNLQWVHKYVNFMKLNHNEKKFIEWCKIVARFKSKLPEEYVK